MKFDEKAARVHLKEFIINFYSISLELHDETELVASGIIDSFGIVSLLAEIETEFKIKIPPEELIPKNFSSIKAISSFILKLKNK